MTAARERARRILASGSFACNAEGEMGVAGRDVHRKVKVDGEWVVLFGLGGRPPSHGEMVRQLTQAILDRQEDYP